MDVGSVVLATQPLLLGCSHCFTQLDKEAPRGLHTRGRASVSCKETARLGQPVDGCVVQAALPSQTAGMFSKPSVAELLKSATCPFKWTAFSLEEGYSTPAVPETPETGSVCSQCRVGSIQRELPEVTSISPSSLTARIWCWIWKSRPARDAGFSVVPGEQKQAGWSYSVPLPLSSQARQ